MEIRYLSFFDIIHINRKTTEEHGGNFVPPHNLLREGAVEYVVDIVQKEIFGQKVFHSVPDIASAYFFYLVTGHVFQDGNKRTGLTASLIFLRLNDFRLKSTLVHVPEEGGTTIPKNSQEEDILYQLTIELAAGELTLEQVKAWFAQNTADVEK